MDEVERTRAAAREAVADVTPARLREDIEGHIGDTSAVPGVLTLFAARASGAVPAEETEVPAGPLSRRAAGTQLIYEGLRLTRSLVREDPWGENPEPNIPADVDTLAADVMVARGFALLADTAAAEKAVETVRSFGRSETDRAAGRTPERTLEADVFELAAVAGATVAGGETPLALRQYCVGLADAREATGIGPEAGTLPESVEDVMRRVVGAGAEKVPSPSQD
jgi:hypothetical protein